MKYISVKKYFSGYGLTGPSNIHGSLETGYPNNDFKSAIEYPNGYFKDPSSYAKRAAPSYFLVDNHTSDKVCWITYLSTKFISSYYPVSTS